MLGKEVNASTLDRLENFKLGFETPACVQPRELMGRASDPYVSVADLVWKRNELK